MEYAKSCFEFMQSTMIAAESIESDGLAKLASCMEFTMAMMHPDERKGLWSYLETFTKQMADETFEDSADYIQFLRDKEGI